MEGVRPRFLPVMMTSLAFILGLLPLFLATGASAWRAAWLLERVPRFPPAYRARLRKGLTPCVS
jgi:hypothetical protein